MIGVTTIIYQWHRIGGWLHPSLCRQLWVDLHNMCHPRITCQIWNPGFLKNRESFIWWQLRELLLKMARSFSNIIPPWFWLRKMYYINTEFCAGLTIYISVNLSDLVTKTDCNPPDGLLPNWTTNCKRSFRFTDCMTRLYYPRFVFRRNHIIAVQCETDNGH